MFPVVPHRQSYLPSMPDSMKNNKFMHIVFRADNLLLIVAPPTGRSVGRITRSKPVSEPDDLIVSHGLGFPLSSASWNDLKNLEKTSQPVPQ